MCGGDFFFQAADGIRDYDVTGVQTCALPISSGVCVVGDTVTDAQFARAGGAGLTVIVRNGAGGGDALAALADHVIDSVADLADLEGLEGLLGLEITSGG